MFPAGYAGQESRTSVLSEPGLTRSATERSAQHDPPHNTRYKRKLPRAPETSTGHTMWTSRSGAIETRPRQGAPTPETSSSLIPTPFASNNWSRGSHRGSTKAARRSHRISSRSTAGESVSDLSRMMSRNVARCPFDGVPVEARADRQLALHRDRRERPRSGSSRRHLACAAAGRSWRAWFDARAGEPVDEVDGQDAAGRP